MANADIKTRIVLDANQFDAKLKQAKASTKDYGGIAKIAGSSILKFAAAFGVAASASEAFKKTIGSTQSLTDTFGVATEQAKASVDVFFNSLATSDFSNFLSNMEDAIQKAREFYAEADRLGSMQIFQSNDVLRVRRDMQIQKNIIKDKNSSSEEVEQAKSNLKRLNDELLTMTNKYATQARKTYYSSLREKLTSYGAGKFSDSTLEHYFSKFDTYDQASAQFDRLEKRADELKQKVPTYITTMYGTVQSGFTSVATEASKAITDSVEYRFLRAVREIGDKALSEAKQYEAIALQSELDAATQIGSNYRQLNAGGGKGGKNDVSYGAGSIGYLEQELTNLNKEFNAAVTDAARYSIQQKIDELQKAIAQMKALASWDKTYNPNLKVDSIRDKDSKTLKGNISAAYSNLSVSPIKSPITKKDVKTSTDYAESLEAISGAMATLNTAMAGGSKTFLSFTAVSGTAIAQMIMQLQSLCTAKGVTSAMDLPFPASLAAAVTVVSTIASVFAALPKFETGGIVPGASYSGDNITARVNSGEMILNRAQQSNLFSMINNGPSYGSQKVEFILRGDRLVGALDNWKSRRGKV